MIRETRNARLAFHMGVLVLTFFSVASLAYSVPQKIPVQGRLTNASTGVVLSGEYNFTFRIYNASTSGTLLWDENQTLTVDGNGLWDALLGNNTSLSLNFSEDTYLEVELNHDGNPLPRVQLGSTPYAERADAASNLSCTDCLGTTEIEDVYLLNTGDNATGDYMFNGSFKIENSTGSPLFYLDSSDGNVGIGTITPTNKLLVNPDNADNDGIVLDCYQSSLGSIKNSINNGAFFELTDVNGTRTHMFRSYGNSYVNTGYVGIGTISPLYPLHIVSSTNPGLKLETDSNDLYPYLIIDSNRSSGTVNTTGEISFQNNADSIAYIKVYEDGATDAGTIRIGTQPTGGSATDRLTINSSGHVGIGTNDPSARLHISEPSGATNIDLLMESGSGMYWNMRVGYTSGNLYFSNMTTLTDYRVTFTPTGKVGIGTTNPNQMLDVYGSTGNISISNTAETPAGILFLDADAPTTQYGKILWDSGNTQGSTYYTIGFYTVSESPRLLIGSDGYVGIGTTSPERMLHIKSSLPYMVWEESDAGNKKWQMGGYSGLLTIWEDMAAVRFTIQNETGYVGIGTTSPRTLLDVGDITQTAPARIVFHPGTSTNSAGMYSGFYHHDTIFGSYLDGSYAHGFVSVGYTGTERAFSIGMASSNNYTVATFVPILTVKNTGYVGIGTTSPNKKLVVVGDANITGNLYVSGQQMTVPDYVFDEGYDLMPLRELDVYIKSNRHLPGISSGDETGQIDIVGQQQKLLEKIEELTLYTLGQEERIEGLEEENDRKDADIEAIRRVNEALTARIDDLSAENQGLKQLVCADHPGAAVCKDVLGF